MPAPAEATFSYRGFRSRKGETALVRLSLRVRYESTIEESRLYLLDGDGLNPWDRTVEQDTSTWQPVG